MSFPYLYHSRLDDEKTNNAGMNQEVREFQTKISGLTSRNVELEAANSSLQKRMADLLKEMEDKEANFRNEMARKVNENMINTIVQSSVLLSCPTLTSNR